MTDKTKVTLRKKELSTIIDADLAQQMWARENGHWVAIIEIRHKHHGEDVDTGKDVDLVIGEFEIVDDGILDGRATDHVRDIMRALHRNRKLAENGPTLPLPGDGEEPTVEGVLEARASLIDEDDAGPKIWDGTSMPNDEPEPPAPDDPAFEPHEYVDQVNTPGCGYAGCGQPSDSTIHQGAAVPS